MWKWLLLAVRRLVTFRRGIYSFFSAHSRKIDILHGESFVMQNYEITVVTFTYGTQHARVIVDGVSDSTSNIQPLCCHYSKDELLLPLISLSLNAKEMWMFCRWHCFANICVIQSASRVCGALCAQKARHHPPIVSHEIHFPSPSNLKSFTFALFHPLP